MTVHTPIARRSLSGKLVPLSKPTDPYRHPHYEPKPSAHARRLAFERLTPEQNVAHLNGTLDTAVLADLVADELTRKPVDDRAGKRAFRKRADRKARRGRVRSARSTIALRLATPAPSRGFLRAVLSKANREADALNDLLAVAKDRHPAGTKVAA